MGAGVAAPVTGRGGAGPLLWWRTGTRGTTARSQCEAPRALARGSAGPARSGGRTAIRPAAAGAVEAEVPRRRNGGVGGGWAMSWLLQ